MIALKVLTLKNCDTCKKALKWLAGQGVDFDNHDVRADGLDEELVSTIVDALGWEAALNRRSTTWRGLSDSDKDGLDNSRAIRLILDHPTLLKRPVFLTDQGIVSGFDTKAQTWLQGQF